MEEQFEQKSFRLRTSYILGEWGEGSLFVLEGCTSHKWGERHCNGS